MMSTTPTSRRLPPKRAAVWSAWTEASAASQASTGGTRFRSRRRIQRGSVLALQCAHHNNMLRTFQAPQEEQSEPLLLRRGRSSDRRRGVRDEPHRPLPDPLPPAPGRAPLPPASQSPPEPCALPQDRRDPLARARMTHNRVSGAFTGDFATLASIFTPIPPLSASIAPKSVPFLPRNTSSAR